MSERPYDVDTHYERVRREDPEVCRRYLVGRKIAPELVDDVIRGGKAVHNRYQGTWKFLSTSTLRGRQAV